ncbi:hypothetical protein BDA96_02G291800 [Sorghum bicolor]|uniref:Uncharacterized protein n=2 Tax=Sorghum bicolor TaxID=4558 RepID=A0A1W0W613_SORBI|nr:hypothetical protein BDA96_02G291800 [Sorghum bicolor]OQU89820.1 hypothetical protein SORBI_3002G277366 [Sorghum bicolor]
MHPFSSSEVSSTPSSSRHVVNRHWFLKNVLLELLFFFVVFSVAAHALRRSRSVILPARDRVPITGTIALRARDRVTMPEDLVAGTAVIVAGDRAPTSLSGLRVRRMWAWTME